MQVNTLVLTVIANYKVQHMLVQPDTFTSPLLRIAPSVGPTLMAKRCDGSDEFSMKITWEDIPHAQARGVIRSYTIYWAPYSGVTPTNLNPVVRYVNESNIVTVSGLSVSTQYYVTAQANTSAGAGVWSAPVIVPSKYSLVYPTLHDLHILKFKVNK